jgi:hypothetical protein
MLFGVGAPATWMARGVAPAGNTGLQDRASDRRVYGQRLEERGREGLGEEALRKPRPGWVLGGEAFRDRVMDWMKKNRAGRGRAGGRKPTLTTKSDRRKG